MPSRRPDKDQTKRPRTPRKGAASTHGFADKSRGIRLQKALADAGVAARRECEDLVLEGAVTVNGQVVDTLPAWVDPASDRIEVFGRPLRKPESHHYIVLFKPRGTVCTNSDPEGRPRAIDLVQHPSRPRLYCVGRLDLDSSGLIVLTNDGEFANRLTHPRYGVSKGYEVTLDGRLDDAAVAELERRIFGARGRHERESSMRLLKREKDRTVVAIELCEHRNLQIRPLMLELGHPVKKLRRTSFGPLRLKGLGVGEWRELTTRELSDLRRASSGRKEVAAAAEPARPRDPDVMAKRTARTLAKRAEEERVAREAAELARGEELQSRRPGAKKTGKPTVKPASKPASKPAAKPTGRADGRPGGATMGRTSTARGGKSRGIVAGGAREGARGPARAASRAGAAPRTGGRSFSKARGDGPKQGPGRSGARKGGRAGGGAGAARRGGARR